MKHNIGFIGLGHMGYPMAKNLLQSDLINKLYISDLNPEPVNKLVELGAHNVDNISEMASQTDIIFTMLQTGEQVKSVCLGEQGIFSNATDNLVYIDCSSIDVQSCQELHNIAKQEFGIQMLDAPVSGGVKGAEAASLTIMVGGNSDIFNQAKPILDKLGQNIIHAGNNGTGQIAKICNNMILGISMIAVSEAFNLGKSLGIEPGKLHEIVSKGSGQCWSLTKYCPYPGIMPDVPSSNDYKAGFTSSMMLKDLNLSQEAANLSGVNTQMGQKARELYEKFSKQDSEQDFSGIINFLNE